MRSLHEIEQRLLEHNFKLTRIINSTTYAVKETSHGVTAYARYEVMEDAIYLHFGKTNEGIIKIDFKQTPPIVVSNLTLKVLTEIQEDLRTKLILQIKSSKRRTEEHQKAERKKVFGRLRFLMNILPKSSREEALIDLYEMIREMKKDNCHKAYIVFIVVINIVSVIYHTLMFKLKDYFYPEKAKSRRE
ncbi:hypothetical protein GWK08_00335 [Leptobacterium flavescens]|uniref:Uncharacterized protein n=1 Tax=Leptobacterium flavescens TaxID=472055 RepID=A0A6P0UNH8_9FLAO|nr:hypothetical protein [Leptobacterium flavescens]NER11876.1 hypothetical protein [Leptobacterium flavescens]